MQRKQQVRIIGGKWRGRKLSFPDSVGLRPTPDRVRETLFNWLAPVINDAYCLDLFAGSGALGFEALSRGAREVIMVDKSAAVISQLQANCNKLGVKNVMLYQAVAPDNVYLPLRPFDIIFLDPPFHQHLLPHSCAWLQEHTLIKPGSLVYIESEKTLDPLPIPVNWQLFKKGKTAQIAYYLIKI